MSQHTSAQNLTRNLTLFVLALIVVTIYLMVFLAGSHTAHAGERTRTEYQTDISTYLTQPVNISDLVALHTNLADSCVFIQTDTLDEITEGTTNLFYTNERVDDRVNGLMEPSASSYLTWSYDDGSNTLTPVLDGTLKALAGTSSMGIIAYTSSGADTFASRTLTGTTNEISITNGDGVSGNPTIALSSSLDLSAKAVIAPSSTTLPVTCGVGEIYMDTDATAGQKLYACESTDTWVLQGDGGGTAIVRNPGEVIYDSAGSLIGIPFYDDDTMANDDPLGLASQQSIKAYVDAATASGIADGDKGDIVVSGSGTVWTADLGSSGDLIYNSGGSVVGINESEFKPLFNLEIGTDVQAYDADLTTYAGITPSSAVQGLLAAASYSAARTLLNVEDAATANPNAIDNVVEDTTPQLGGDLDINTQMLKQIFTACAGNTFTSGEIAYISSGECMAKMDASDASTATAGAAIALDTIAASTTGPFGLWGVYTTTGMTAGAIQYSSTTAGAMTEIPPTNPGEIQRILGVAYTSSTLFFHPDTSWYEN